MTQPTVEPSLIPAIPDGVAWRAYDGEVMVVRISDGQLLTLSGVGSFAYEKFDGCTDLKTIAHAICEEFDVTEDTASDDLLAFADDLHRRCLIDWVE